MRNKEDIQKEIELKYGEFFIEWLNKKRRTDYKVHANSDQNSDVDVFATSKTGKNNLRLQMATSDGETLKLGAENKKRFKKKQDFADVIEVDPAKRISIEVEKKQGKHYSNEQDLILIIQGFSPVPEPKEIEREAEKYKQLPFKGIYYVSLPVVSSTHYDYEEKGYVAAIKDAFI